MNPLGLISGWGANRRLKEALTVAQGRYDKGERDFVVVGFSRGGASALSLSNKMSERLEDADIKLGLFDAVGSFGAPGNGIEPGHDTNVGKNVSGGLHITANDERRDGFGLTSVAGTVVKEVGVGGVHSEIGGSYPSRVNGPGIANKTLGMMHDYLSSEGVKLDSIPNKYSQESDVSTHESLSRLGRAWEGVKSLFTDDNKKKREIYQREQN
jgi:hypothetical protein